jgi:hypothetical protein
MGGREGAERLDYALYRRAYNLTAARRNWRELRRPKGLDLDGRNIHVRLTLFLRSHETGRDNAQWITGYL